MLYALCWLHSSCDYFHNHHHTQKKAANVGHDQNPGRRIVFLNEMCTCVILVCFLPQNTYNKTNFLGNLIHPINIINNNNNNNNIHNGISSLMNRGRFKIISFFLFFILGFVMILNLQMLLLLFFSF